MKAIILAAGYGTRLEKDLTEDRTGKYTHLMGIPKPLLPCGGLPLVSHWIQTLARCPDLKGYSDVYLVTNDVHYPLYKQWAIENEFPVQNIINDGTRSNADRLGAIRDIELVIDEKNIQDHLLIIGGDTLFKEDFDLSKLIRCFSHKDSSLVLSYHVEDPSRYGIIEVGENGLVTSFLEKPSASQTKSRNACPCLYFLHKSTIPYLKQYIRGAPHRDALDAPGTFLGWLFSRSRIYAKEISGRFDIGSLPTYLEADVYLSDQARKKQVEGSKVVSKSALGLRKYVWYVASVVLLGVLFRRLA